MSKMMNTAEFRKGFIENAANRMQKALENAGYDIDITTLTSIRTRISEQKFYNVRVSDYMPVVLGEGVLADEQKVYLEDLLGDEFESGVMGVNGNAPKKNQASTQLRNKTFYRHFWKIEKQHNLLQMQQASLTGNWSLIEAQEKSARRQWDLGLQKIAFLGMESDSRIKGLLTQDDVNSNLTVITTAIKDMTSTQFEAFLGGVIDAYYQNSNSTVYPDTFVMPTGDYNGLARATDETFPLKSRLERMREAFVEVTQNPDFKILPIAYAASSQSGLGVERYVMYRRNDADSLFMDIPVDYTTTAQDTMDGFNYNAVSYGQFSGCNVIRPEEMLYFDY